MSNLKARTVDRNGLAGNVLMFRSGNILNGVLRFCGRQSEYERRGTVDSEVYRSAGG